MSLTATKRTTPPSSTGIWSAPAVQYGGRPVGDEFGDPAHGLGEAFPADRFQYVVDGFEVEGLHGETLVRGDEDDQRGPGEPREQLGDVETGEPGHVDIEEDDVDGRRFIGRRAERATDAAQRFGGAQRALRAADPGSLRSR